MVRNLHKRGVADVPIGLTHDLPVVDLWHDKNLLLSQCCRYDVINAYKDELKPIATPIYNSPTCLGHYYCSLMVVPATVNDYWVIKAFSGFASERIFDMVKQPPQIQSITAYP